MNKQRKKSNYSRSSNNLNNKKYNSYYSKSSEALKYAPSYQPQYEPSIKKKTRKVIRERYVLAEKNEKIFSINFFVVLSIFVSIAVSFVGINAKILQRKFEINNLNSQLKEIKEDNKNLEIEIAKNLDLDYIENYANKKLKMQKPATHQIVHISIPKESYTVKNNIIENKENTYFEKFNLFNILK